ncbi:VanW family protein [Bacillus cereus]|uniref:Vancomycin B-type resistance protein VanW n=1 Tax=Bacillus cereus TaxID=1396 RepID=A0A9X7GTE9_BACCE|nr:VanW family protein [Bacillus cereus]OUB35676.1 hypothetical protein BK708_04515 [Bacillus thuringiensis serovar yunnanensis]MCC2504287.1 VanW family protein [Bacillus cereus]MCH5475700.1 VanW family protein [Bacillus cereus]MCU4979428.1 VanW family protein [Bacillus cereus]PGS66837.1 hypothetical protein COC69_28355 [Bacillus cereus]
MFRKVKGILVGVLCVAIMSGCGAKVSDVALVSDIGGHTVEAKAEVQDTISLVDGRTGTEVKKLDLSSLGYFEDEAKFTKSVTKVVGEIGKSVDKKMVPSRIAPDGSWQEGKPSYELMEKELVDKLLNVGMWDATYQLPIVEKKPVATLSDAQGNGTVIGRYETNLGGSTGGRIENIRLSAASINGVVLAKGDRFSFNSLIGDTTPDKGYQLGKEIVDGKLVDGYGGGVCQTSSTLYNAADQAGLKMVERTTHSKTVGYVPQGRDATIAYPYLDLVFENTNDAPVKLYMGIQGGKLVAEVHKMR